MLFVSIELITVSFYVRPVFSAIAWRLWKRSEILILGAMASAFLVYGIALGAAVPAP
jgi:glucose uptake protein GlcU